MGEAAMMEIEEAVPSAKETFVQLDLSSFSSFSAARGRFTTASSRLDLLINNASTMAASPGNTKEGWERQFGTLY